MHIINIVKNIVMLNHIIIISFILALVVHWFYTAWKIKRHLHIMQLNSYFNSRYMVWLRQKWKQAFSYQDLLPLVALFGAFFQVPFVMVLLFTITYLKLFLLRTKVAEKKPLIFTARAKRLFGLSLVILPIFYSGLFLLWWRHGDHMLPVIFAGLIAYNFLIPIVLMLVNFTLMPIELVIQKWYFRDAARIMRNTPYLKVIGITGSFGKTTTKYALAEILRQKYNILMTPGSYNTTMGVTKVIRHDLKPTHNVFIVEMSAKKPGDIKELCDLVNPEYGLITAIGVQHLETFKTLDNIISTKNELIISLPQNGVAFFNMDDVNCAQLSSKAGCNVVRYGIETHATDIDYYACDININEHGSNFTVTRMRDDTKAIFQTKLLGKHNIYNILAAIVMASEIGMELKDMIYPVRQLVSVPHRLELKRMGNDIIFIDDAFNSNPVGSKMALDVLHQFTHKRKIIITPGMIELGKQQDELNTELGRYIAQVCDYVILVGVKQTAAIKCGLLAKNYPESQLFVAADFACARKHMEQILKPGDVVLFENDLPDNYAE